MSEITTKIKGVKKDVAKNGKTFYRVTLDDGTVAFAWDWKHIANAKIGQEAMLTVEKQGNYLYITDSKLVESESPEEIESQDGPEEVEDRGNKEEAREGGYKSKMIKPANSTDVAIARMSALKTATEYLNYCATLDSDASPVTEENLIEIAKRLEEFIYNGK